MSERAPQSLYIATDHLVWLQSLAFKSLSIYAGVLTDCAAGYRFTVAFTHVNRVTVQYRVTRSLRPGPAFYGVYTLQLSVRGSRCGLPSSTIRIIRYDTIRHLAPAQARPIWPRPGKRKGSPRAHSNRKSVRLRRSGSIQYSIFWMIKWMQQI